MNIFTNKDNRLRAGLRILIMFGICYFIAVVLSTIMLTVNTAISLMGTDAAFSLNTSNYMYMLTTPISFLIGSIITIKLVDRKKLKDFGFIKLAGHYKDLVYGLVLGAVSMAIIFFILYYTGQITLINTKPVFTWGIIKGLILFIFVGIAEELVSRGYCLKVISEKSGKIVAVIISSLIFSFNHIFNPNVSIPGLINIFLVGILFGYMLIKTNNLWMPIGYHITWNYFQGNIFGFPVSGTTPDGIYNIRILEDNLISGGSFGPEGGFIATGMILIGFVAVFYYNSNKRKHTNIN